MKQRINMLFSLYNFHEEWAKESVKKYINKDDHVLIIPLSFGNSIKDNNSWNQAYDKGGKYYLDIIRPFLAYGIKEDQITWLNYFQDSTERAIYQIEHSDILFFTGGYPDQMMERLKSMSLVTTIENFHGVIIGTSAGAMIQLANYHITPDDDYQTFTYQTGLNCITDFDIEVHYKRHSLQDDYIEKVLKETIDTVYAITDQGGIIVSNKDIFLLGDVCVFCI